MWMLPRLPVGHHFEDLPHRAQQTTGGPEQTFLVPSGGKKFEFFIQNEKTDLSVLFFFFFCFYFSALS